MANLITLGRLALVLPFAAAFMANASWNLDVALAIFALAAFGDFLDGRVARARSEVTALGAALDPIADKVLIAVALMLLVRNGVVRGPDVVAALAVVAREVFVSGLREATARTGATLDVTGLSKWKTAAQIAAVGFLLAAAPTGILGEAWRPLGVGLLWFAALVTVWTGGQYARAAARHFRAAS
ncbi:MAG: CDP-alcohol phosphatidyltransferase family protein [Parvularculaceae bacterium]